MDKLDHETTLKLISHHLHISHFCQLVIYYTLNYYYYIH